MLHHIQPIQHEDGVYDLNNIIVATPRYHAEVLLSSTTTEIGERVEKLNREQMIALVERVMRPGFPEEEDAAVEDALIRSTGNPHVFNLIFHPKAGKENMTAESIVDEALTYRPIEL